MATKGFLKRLMDSTSQVLLYEDGNLQQKALLIIPLAELQEKAAAALGRLVYEESPELRDQLAVELLAWFKLEFFTWFDKGHCARCNTSMELAGYVEPTAEDLKFGATTVEGYRCKQCNSTLRFPRYNHPSKLLQTRAGRCGEWANCFSLMCRSLGYDTRYVLDWTDHVWTEIYSDHQQRWVHCDSCEAAFDKPLIYEAGWGKKLTYVIAFSKDEVQDVTWRYTSNHKEILRRRNLVSEPWLIQQMLLLRGQLQAKLSNEKRLALASRLLKELCQLMLPPVAAADEIQGRTSGDVAWRSARGELGSSGIPLRNSVVWKPTSNEIETGDFCLDYSCSDDVYVRTSDQSKKVRGWQRGVFESSDVFRKVEFDWKMAYLARTENSSTGIVSWKFDLSSFKDLSILQVLVSCPGETFDSGTIEWSVCTENSCQVIPNGSKNYEVDASGAKWCTLTARLSGGTSWQHAQVARQPLSDKTCPLMLRVYFGNFS